jgi:hypothetical protein
VRLDIVILLIKSKAYSDRNPLNIAIISDDHHFASQNSENTRYIVEGFFSVVLKFTALLWRAKSEVVRPNHIYTLLELKGGTIRLMPLASYKQRLRKDRTNKHI